MYISGTDFYDSSSSGAMCPLTNQLSLNNIRYLAVNGGYTSVKNKGIDKEGYSKINYGNSLISDKDYRIISNSNGNSLTPGGEMSIKFKLNVPNPCNGNFDSGQLYFWGQVSGNEPFSHSVGSGMGIYAPIN